jgi:glycosyltransferase involved in cell wall biosynthesis
MDVSIVVPVYRGESFIEPLVERVASALPKFAKRYELILVNDGSSDNSWAVIERMAREYPWVNGVRLMRNYGQHNATLCGVRIARYETIVTMDQDLQHQPEDIPALLDKLNEGFDVVYGAPKTPPNGVWRNLLTASIKRILSNIMGTSSVRNISAFRAFRAHLRAAFENFRSPTVILDVLLSWGTTRFASVQVNVAPTADSHYTFSSLARAAILVLTGYSTMPLHLASWIGFFMTVFGLAVFLYVVYVYFALGSVPGFPFLASIISLFGGAQLFALGIIGEYLARIFDRSMDRPSYIIRETAGQ